MHGERDREYIDRTYGRYFRLAVVLAVIGVVLSAGVSLTLIVGGWYLIMGSWF